MYKKPYPADLEIEETPDSLVIRYRGNQHVGRAYIYLLSSIFAFVILIFLFAPSIIHLIQSEVGIPPLLIICPGIFITLYIYGAYVSLTWALDLMLDREKITITANNLIIEKSGFRSIHLSREFLLYNSNYLHPMFLAMLMDNMIELSPSRLLARIGQAGGGRSWLFASPMRWFCRGLSKEEQVAVLQRIKGKFSNINILMDYDPLVRPG
jgi:hypothetical protein